MVHSLLRWPLVGLVLALVLSACGGGSPSAGTTTGIDSVAYRDSFAKAQAASIEYDRAWNDLARYLGGMEGLPGSLYNAEERESAAVKHRKWFDEAMAKKEERILRELRAFAAAELGDAYRDTTAVFYPFASFDFLHVYHLYPEANRYVLFGLEPEGHAPDLKGLSPERRALNLANVQQSLNDILPLSFSMTNDMKVELKNIEYDGTAPLLLAFLARTGMEVLGVEHVKITPQGTVAPSDKGVVQNPNDGVVTGIRVRFRAQGGAGRVREVLYFSQDASDNGLKERPEFVAYLTALAPARGFVKSASYLMHKDYFSKSRSALLSTVTLLVQDDSGVPFRFFTPTTWKLQGYGAYGPATRPIALFSNWYQNDLADFYQSTPIRPLPFGIGYRYQEGSSNWLIARKR